MSEIQLLEAAHPSKGAASRFESLVGIDTIKESLVDELTLILDKTRLQNWLGEHHPNGLAFVDKAPPRAPLILLSGEVGCGKTALANCVATPVARAIDQRILSMETPSDIRGSGHVGEVSLRITAAFSQAKVKAAELGRGILIIDEADDLATSRSQMQAHHEDRAGVNVLIKQIDQLATHGIPMAVILITNRADALDPAVMRRVALPLKFERPGGTAREAVFRRILDGSTFTTGDIDELVSLTERDTPYTFSDLTDRVARIALRQSWKENRPFGPAMLKSVLSEVEPSPPFAVVKSE